MAIRSLLRRLTAGFALPVALVGVAGAQTQTRPVDPEINVQRSMVTRSELQQALVQIDQDANAAGYSQALRDARKAEGDAIRDRLENGDIRPGDRLTVTVANGPAYSREYQVSPTRTILLPSGAELSVAHLLRSELSDSLAAKLKPYFNDPRVTAYASIRVQISGAVGHNGFFWAPASDLLSTVLMEEGGGPAREADLAKSEIRRGDIVVVSGADFQTALHDGKSLDALNVQAGDEIRIAEKPAGGKLVKILGAVGALGSVLYLVRSIF